VQQVLALHPGLPLAVIAAVVIWLAGFAVGYTTRRALDRRPGEGKQGDDGP
jgi:hypothetical protein